MLWEQSVEKGVGPSEAPVSTHARNVGRGCNTSSGLQATHLLLKEKAWVERVGDDITALFAKKRRTIQTKSDTRNQTLPAQVPKYVMQRGQDLRKRKTLGSLREGSEKLC